MSLIGDAAHTIDGLQITNKNCDEAVDLLKHFEKKQIIFSHHIESLMDLPNEDLSGLLALYDRIEAATCTLKSVGVPSSNYSAIPSPNIMSKLPQDVRLLIS